MRLIDADALKNDLTRFYNNAVTAKQLIDEQPTVDAAPVVHGHWIYKKSGRAECSVCHHDFVGVYDLDNSDNFCRHCGAKMDGGEIDGKS